MNKIIETDLLNSYNYTKKIYTKLYLKKIYYFY